jgi:hypothetical protein
MNIETAHLVLNSSTLTANTTNVYGTCSQYKTSYTFNNISMRNVLGSLYDKYKTFNLIPISILSSVGSATFGATPDDTSVYITLNGLPFTNSYFSVPNQRNSNTITLSPLDFNNSNTNGATNSFFNAQFTFNKTDNVNLKFDYIRIVDNTPVGSTSVYPDVIYLFMIAGVELDDTKHF